MPNDNNKINRYKDLEGVTMGKLNIGLWYVENRLNFINILKYTLIAVSLISWSYFFYGFGEYIFFGMKADDRILNELTTNYLVSPEILLQKGAKDLIIENPMVIRQNGKNDIVSIVQNPNDNFYAKFDYTIRSGEKELKKESAFVLPMEKSYLTALGQEIDNGFDPQIDVENIKWKRINAHIIPDWESYKSAHLNFEISDPSIVKADDFNKPDNKSINFAEIKFSIKNNTAYNYLAPEFIILLRNSFGISGINKYTIDRFQSEEKRDISINWADAPPDAVNMEIIPNINIIDGGIYFKFDSADNLTGN